MDLTLSERFLLIALNGHESEHRETAKQNILKVLAAAIFLEENYDLSTGKWNFTDEQMKEAIKKANKKELEQTYTQRLQEKQLLTKVSSLLGCDLYYDKNIKIKTYVSDAREFECQLDMLRAEFLEEGPVSEESILLAWLLLESLCFNQVFSVYEQNKILERMTSLQTESTLARALYPIDIRSLWGTVVAGFLRLKSQAAATETGKGINFIYPFLERKQSIFIDTEEYFPNAQMRLNNVLDRISSQGHAYEVLRAGSVPIVKIDNVKYELIPEAISGRIPIYGVRLRRYNR